MEGLLLAEALRPLEGRLPVARGAWRFPDARTLVLPLAAGEATTLWILSRPPSPRLSLRAAAAEGRGSAGGAPNTPFQAQLAARAVGPLTAVRQRGLDRVVELDFGAGEGFVPQPPVTLVAELTGRNANLLLLDERRDILGVERVILQGRNRYRELKPGIAYRPPPPYDKLDPRHADADALAGALLGVRLERIRGVVDGIGPELTAALATGCGVPLDAPLEGRTLASVVAALSDLVATPSAWLERTGGARGLDEQRRLVRREDDAQVVHEARRRRLDLAEKRLRDAERALERVRDGERLRSEADLLMAYPQAVPAGAQRVRLTGFGGEERELVLDPREDAFHNARRRYERARRLERRAVRARAEWPTLEAEQADARRAAESVDTLDDDELHRLAEEVRAARDQRRRPSEPGIRFTAPHGFEVVVGRNARENDAVTFRVARSRDLWLHVQGFRGSHVVVRAGGAEVPFDTVLFAARLAAGFSPARHSDNVPVDYTLRKHVWKVKGQPPGAVRFSQQKTVYVTPARNEAGADPERATRRRAGGDDE